MIKVTFSWKSPFSWTSRILEKVRFLEKVRIPEQVTFSWKSPNSWTSRFSFLHFYHQFDENGSASYQVGVSSHAIGVFRGRFQQSTSCGQLLYIPEQSRNIGPHRSADDDCSQPDAGIVHFSSNVYVDNGHLSDWKVIFIPWSKFKRNMLLQAKHIALRWWNRVWRICCETIT